MAGLGGFLGFYVKTGNTIFTTPSNYTVPPNFRCIVTVITPCPGNSPNCPTPGNPATKNCPGNPPTPGNPGTPGPDSTFGGSSVSQTYSRKTSALAPRSIQAIVAVGSGSVKVTVN